MLLRTYISTGQPIFPNPCLTKNVTHLTLMWSPPFLWPGKRIQQYNISIRNNSDGSIQYHMLNASLTNPVVMLPFYISSSLLQVNTQNMLLCMSWITFSISPIDGSILEPMQTFNVSDWAWSFPSGDLYHAVIIIVYWINIFYWLIFNYYLSFSCVYVCMLIYRIRVYYFSYQC